MKISLRGMGGVLAMLMAGEFARAQTTERASVSSAGAQSNSGSSKSSVSADGRFVAFSSAASNLVAGDTNAMEDVFVRDRLSATTERVSVATGGAQANSFSHEAMISADGNFVLFFSAASNLVAGDTNSAHDAFVRDRLSGTTERVSVGAGGVEASGSSYPDWISADGRFVTFHSDASNLVAGDTNGFFDVFVRDRVGLTTERVSVATGGAEANSGSYESSISEDSRFVVFSSDATNLAAGGDTNLAHDIFVRDRVSGSTERVNVSTGGAEGNAWSQYPSISGDGHFVTFESQASNLVAGDTNGCADVFVRDLAGGTTERVSLGAGGVEGDWNSRYAALSRDGRLVAFESGSSNLVANDTNGHADIFVRDRLGGTTERVSLSTIGTQANAPCTRPAISAAGQFVTFDTPASNLVSADTNGSDDIFVRDRGSPPPIPFCFGDGTGTACPCGNTGAAGNGCAHSLDAGGANLAGTGSTSLALDTLVLTGTGMPDGSALYLQGLTQVNGGLGIVFGDGLRCAGGTVVRLGLKTNVGGMSQYPAAGDLPISVIGIVSAPGTRTYQVWYRNSASFCTASTFNLTNGSSVLWTW